MKSAQEFVHWLEMGAGARWLRRFAVVAVTVALSLLITWKQFRGPQSEATLEQADVARQLARGHGFSTLINYPQTVALRTARGDRFDPARPLPELHHAPFYSIVIAGALRALPNSTRERLFAMPMQPGEGYNADYFLVALNLGLFWLTAWLTYRLGRGLFDERVGWTAALGVLLSLAFWQQTLALNGTPLLMVLGLGAFLVWRRIETKADAAESEPTGKRRFASAAFAWLVGLGVICALLFLTEYTAGCLLLTAVGYAGSRFRGRARWMAFLALVAGFLVVAGPWLVRNVALTGHPVALAGQEIALKAGDPTAEPTAVRATLSAEGPALSLRKLGNKTLTSLQDTLKTRLWAGGAMWFVAFFVAGWLYAFRSAVTNRLRWVFTASLGLAVVTQAALNSGESERLAVVWLAPLIIVFGTGFFFVLLESNATLGAWPRVVAAVLLLLQSLPLVHDAMAPPPAVRFSYPPYFPALLRGLRTELEARHASGEFGVMADVPAGAAWYGQTRVWAQPPRLRDFYAVTLAQPIGELLLTPRTLDRPFFTELNARAVVPGSLGTVANRFGDWGEVYAGLITGTMPREFPLNAPHRVAENLYVLLNPRLPPIRGK